MSEIGGVAVAELVKSSFRSISAGVLGGTSKLYSTIVEDFNEYMKMCYSRNRYVRILCQGDDDVDILDIYVPIAFSNNTDYFEDDQLIQEIGGGGNYIVTGNGGAGKTFFMRKLWLDLFRERQRTPLFIELRKLNDTSGSDLETFIRISVSRNIAADVFEKFCVQGRFVLLLDGFDELPTEHYEEVQSEILKMAEKYPNCSIVTSSRPDARFAGWTTFKKVEAIPFTLEQTKNLCSNVPFDDEFRKKFIKILTRDFFRMHESFLSNPLLAIMMMMTFKRNMDVPTRIGIFYDEAFSTLYQKHDATKAYKRKKNLDILQFRRSFGVFCLLSYVKEKFDFSQTEIEDYIVRASKLIDLDVDASRILSDYERNVNLIMLDGHRYYFIHRSFQEYFAAWALVNEFPHRFTQFAEIIEQRQSDNVIKICYDLRRSLVVTDYFAPKFEKFSKEIGFGGCLSNSEIWNEYLECIRLHVGANTDGNSTRDFNYGVGVEIEQKFLYFSRNLLKIRDVKTEADDVSIAFGLVSIFSRFLLGSDRVCEMIIQKMLEIGLLCNLPVEIEVSVDFDSKKITICNLTSDKENYDKLTCINLNKNDLKVLEKYSEEVYSILSSMAIWCKSEINSVRDTDRQVDKLFLA